MINHIQGSSSSRVGLGVRKPTVRGPLHDPDADGAVVLYTPPPLSAQDATNPEIK
jgi:DNA repair and recombination RAD54-like protein